MRKMVSIPVVIYRGGTSKAVFIKANELPRDAAQRDRLVCSIFGSPDKRQIDGLGGADPLTSKLAIIGPSSRPDADVDYTFGQVSIDEPSVFFGAVCGNISAAVGPYAIDEGFVSATDPVTRVRINCTNNKRIIEALVPTSNNRVEVKGDYAIDGVPGTGARIDLNWADTVGANTGRLLPTGNPKDTLDVEGVGKVTVSIVDVGNIGVFAKAKDMNLSGKESPDEIDSNTDLIAKSNAIVLEVIKKTGAIALLTYVAPPCDYQNYLDGKIIRASESDFLVRMIFMNKLHKTYSASQINCCGTAAKIPGTVVNEVAASELSERDRVIMGHPSGTAELEEIKVVNTAEGIVVKKLTVFRTARRLMEGYAYVAK